MEHDKRTVLAETDETDRDGRRPRRGSALPAVDDQSDTQLWRAWRKFDRRAFEELFRRYHPRARSLASSMHLSDEDAQDIAQETMLGLSDAGCLIFGPKGLDDYVCDLAAGNARQRRRDNRRRGQSLLALESVGRELRRLDNI